MQTEVGAFNMKLDLKIHNLSIVWSNGANQIRKVDNEDVFIVRKFQLVQMFL